MILEDSSDYDGEAAVAVIAYKTTESMDMQLN